MLYLFDIDGTLLLSGGAGSRALNAIFERRYELTEAMRDVSPGGKTDPLILTEIFVDRLGRTPEENELEEILDEYVPLLEKELSQGDGFQVMPAAVETVRFFAGLSSVTMGIATGNVQGAARAKLAHIDLWKYFAFGGFGDDDGDRARLVEAAIRRGRAHADVELADEQVVVVGDTERDVHAARACGVRVVAVTTGQTSRAALLASEPDAVFETLAELPAWHESNC